MSTNKQSLFGPLFIFALGVIALLAAWQMAVKTNHHRGGGYVDVVSGLGDSRETIGQEHVDEQTYKAESYKGAMAVGLLGTVLCYCVYRHLRDRDDAK